MKKVEISLFVIIMMFVFGCVGSDSIVSQRSNKICDDGYCVNSIQHSDNDFLLSPADYSVAQTEDGNFVSSNTLLVKFNFYQTADDIEKIIDQIHGKVSAFIPDIDIYELSFDFDSLDQLESVVDQLTGLVEVVNMNRAMMLENLDNQNPPNDTEEGLWGFRQIQLAEAYDYISQNKIQLHPGKIAIMDSGFDLSHHDLAGVNVEQYDFVDVDHDVSTTEGHGTAVAGIIFAQNNGVGINGIAFDSDFLAYRTSVELKGVHYDFESTIAAAVIHSVKHSAKVINISSGFYNNSLPILHSAIAKAHEQNVVVVASVGNGNAESSCMTDWTSICEIGDDASKHYPSAFPEVISVGCVNSLGARSSFSNYSQYDDQNILTLAGPGENVLLLQLNNGYALGSGTSFASPAVVGLAGLLLEIRPELSPDEVRQTMTDSADLAVVTYPDGSAHTWKKINVLNAVKKIAISNQNNFGRICELDSDCDPGLICLVEHCSTLCYNSGETIAPDFSSICQNSNCYSTCPSGYSCEKFEDMFRDNPDGIRGCIKDCLYDSDCTPNTYCRFQVGGDYGICYWHDKPLGEICGAIIEGFDFTGCLDNLRCIMSDEFARRGHLGTGHCFETCDSGPRFCSETTICWPTKYQDIFGNSGCGLCTNMENKVSVDSSCFYLNQCPIDAPCIGTENNAYCRELCVPGSSICQNSFTCYHVQNDCNDQTLGVCAP